jgi:predicted aldo/keto reductase-like oxidoreductase
MKKKVGRRKFVKTTAAATAAVTILPSVAYTGSTSSFDSKGLPTKKLGSTGVDVPRMGFGCGSRWMSVENDDEALGILEYAHDNGLYYWDTAGSYGNERISSEERIGKLLPDRRDKVFLVSKTQEREADAVKAGIETSLKRLNTDYIDLMHMHSIASVEDAESLGDPGMALEVLHDYRDQGIIRHIGFTGHTTAMGMKRAAELYDFEVMMIALNHQVPSGEEKFEEDAVVFAANKGMGVVAMKVIRPRETIQELSAEDLISYALSIEHFSLVNIGTDSMDVLKANLELLKQFKPLDEQKMNDLRIALTPFYRHENLAWMHPSYRDGWHGKGIFTA